MNLKLGNKSFKRETARIRILNPAIRYESILFPIECFILRNVPSEYNIGIVDKERISLFHAFHIENRNPIDTS